jgi:hypothetical protein
MSPPDISRFWRYRYGSWQPQWYRYLIPDFRGSDELGRRTVVFHVPFVGFLVWAYRTCKCEDCCEVREKELWRDWHATT